jgi:ribosomal protein L11
MYIYTHTILHVGPLGLNMAEFCKQFNEATKLHEKDVPVPVTLSVCNICI